MAKIVVAGSLNMDLVALAPRIPSVGETIIGTGFFTGCGGKGGNQAYAAAMLGADTAMLGSVGDDDFGKALCAGLTAAGCDVSGVTQTTGPSGVALIAVGSAGENSIIVAPGANNEFRFDPIRLHNARILLLQLEIPLAEVSAAARTAKERGVTVILDPAPARELTDALLRCVDILTPNESEAAILTGTPPARLDLPQALRIARQLQARGPLCIIMKLGDQGCLVLDRDAAIHIAAPQVNAIDTTAAGDIFNAALATGLTEGLNIPDACEFAVAASALSVTRRGAQAAAPTRAEVDAARSAFRISRSPVSA